MQHVRHTIDSEIIALTRMGQVTVAVLDSGQRIAFTTQMLLHHCPIEGARVIARDYERENKLIGKHYVASRKYQCVSPSNIARC